MKEDLSEKTFSELFAMLLRKKHKRQIERIRREIAKRYPERIV